MLKLHILFPQIYINKRKPIILKRKYWNHLSNRLKNYLLDKKDEDNNNESKKIKFKYNKERIAKNKKRINNLYEDYKKILNKRENKKKELSKEEMKDCSFNPKIDKNSKKLALNNPPIFLRDNKNPAYNLFIQKCIFFLKSFINF